MNTHIMAISDAYPAISEYARRSGCVMPSVSGMQGGDLIDYRLGDCHIGGSRVPRKYWVATLDSLAPDQHPTKIKKWLDNPDAYRSLLMSGAVGGGKTYAAYALMLEAQISHFIQHQDFMTPEEAPKLWSVPTLIEALRPSSHWDSLTVYREATTIPLLVLDDFGATRATDFAVESMFRIMDDRTMRELRTVVTTNSDAATMREQWGSPIVDRITDGAGTLVFPSKSRRLRVEL